MRSFGRRLVFLPGGSSGIGLAIARRMVGRGADVVLFARREAQLAAAAESLTGARQRPDQRVAFRPLDVTDRSAVDAVMGATVAELGPPDVLVNCAGRAKPDYFARIDAAALEDTLRVNLFGCWHTIQALLPHMRGREGYIVNTASLAGLIGVFGFTDYCASKFALVGFSEALRSELAPEGITVSVLCPPDVDTPGLAEENRTKPAETHAVSEGARLLDADDVAAALLAGMARRRFLIVPGRAARLSYLAKRLVPGLVAWVMDRQIRKTRTAGERRP